MIYGDTITRLRAPRDPSRRGPGRDWSLADARTFDRVQVQALAPFEPAEQHRESATTTRRVFSQPFTNPDIADIRATDRILINDDPDPFDVVGEPSRWAQPSTGVFHHVEITLRRTTG